jgi:hypothetical protein
MNLPLHEVKGDVRFYRVVPPAQQPSRERVETAWRARIVSREIIGAPWDAAKMSRTMRHIDVLSK